MEKIAIFGMGKMGLPLACAFAAKGFDVRGIDINAERVARVNRKEDVLPFEPGVHDVLVKTVGKTLHATMDTDVHDRDVVILLVPTVVRESAGGITPDLDAVLDVARTVGRTLRKDSIVITECTMPPGATERIGAVIQKASGLKPGADFGLAHCPERTSSGTALRDIRGQYPKIVGASDAKTLEKVAAMYAKINPKGVIRMPSIMAAECVKVFEGIYRDVNIGLANELSHYCEGIGVDAIGVFQAANTQPYSHIHMPSCGVGGHCIPYYPYFVMNEKTPLIQAARRTNDAMPRHTVELLAAQKGAKVVVMGLTFRGGVKEFRKSPGLEIVRILNEEGMHTYACDPLCTDDEIRAFGAEPLPIGQADEMDGIIVCSNHAEFRGLDWAAMVKSMRTRNVVDGVNVVPAQAVRDAGGTFVGIGRA